MNMFRSLPAVLVAWVVLLAATHSPLFAQTLDTGPQVLTFFSDVDDTDQPYAIYLPPNFDASKAYPLVISLHGAGSNHRLNLRRVFGKSNAPGETDVEASRYFPEWEDVEYIVASPYARGTMGYQGVAEKDVMDVLADVKRRFPIDENRIYLTGLSMGGGGALWIGLTRPDLWAAIAPVCPAPPAGTETFAPNALHIPVHFFQGGADPVVDPDSTRAWVEHLRSVGTAVEYTEYLSVGHNSWENAYANGQIFDWFSQFRRDSHPDRVRFATDRYKYNEAYWVQIDRLTPGTRAQIDARFTVPNRIAVTTSDLGAFTLHLAGHPQFTRDRSLELRIDGQDVTVQPADSVSFSRRGEDWMAEPYEPGATAKRPGAEGPMSEVIASRHIYVYGTGGNPSAEAMDARRARALKAANWSVYRGPFLRRVKVFPRVVADTLVRPSDLEGANLVLFGTKETNRLIDRFSDRLPLHLDPAAEDYGLVYVYPNEGQYVLISSGLPWWKTGAADGRPRSPFAGAVVAFELMEMQDYLLFDGSSGDIVAAGRFDNRWHLPAVDAEKVRATGAVTVAADGVATRQSL